MTNDMKQNLLQWITGKYTQTSKGANVPQAHEITYAPTTNFIATLKENFTNFQIIDIIPTIYTGNQLNISVVYGNYGTSLDKGFIMLIDGNGASIQLITKFSSNTNFSKWIYMGITEDGQFFATDTNKRILLLNNFAIKTATQANYIVKIRKSYAIPNNSQAYTGTIKGIKKSPLEATYLIYGNTNAAAVSPFVTKFKIDIEQGNEWVEYTYTNTDRASDVGDLYVSNWNNLYFQVGSIDFVSDYVYTEYSISSDTTTMTRTDKIDPIESSFQISLGQLYIVSSQYAYLGLHINASNSYMAIGLIDRVNNTITMINVGYYGTSLPIIRIVNGEIFVASVNEVYSGGEFEYYIRLGRIFNNQYLLQLEKLSTHISSDFINSFLVTKSYNLYTTIFIMGYLQDQIWYYEIYNPNNYNGISYNDYNSFVPNNMVFSGINKPEFARNLYNLQIEEATTTSIVEIPNLNINGITISDIDLIGETNDVILEESDSFQKNIYETLYYNFIHTLSVSNQNDINNVILNNEAASYLNNAISNTCDYNNSQAIKCKITYNDESSTIFTINDIIIVGNKATYSLSVYNANWRPVKTIEILSNDETIIYQTINPVLELDKFYTITQDVVIN